MSKKSAFIISILTIIYCFQGQPFLFTDIHFGGRLFSLKFLIVSLLFIITVNSTRINVKYSRKLIICALYVFLSLVFNFDCYSGILFLFFDAIFFFCIFVLTKKHLIVRNILYKTDIYLSIFVCISILVCFLFFLKMPSIFYSTDIGGYPVFYHKFLGTVSAWGARIVWFFNEPSYTGFYLGVHFFLIAGCDNIKLKWRLFFLTLFLLSFFVVLSLGTFIYMCIALLVLVAVKIGTNTTIIKTSIYIGILLGLFVLPNLNAYNLNQNIVEVENTSTEDRQYRMVLGDKLIQEMSLVDMLVGKGVDSTAKKYRIGLSDAYRKVSVEYGFVFMILTLSFLNKMVGRNLPGYCFIMMAFMSIIVVLTPIFLLSYLSFYNQHRINQECI